MDVYHRHVEGLSENDKIVIGCIAAMAYWSGEQAGMRAGMAALAEVSRAMKETL